MASPEQTQEATGLSKNKCIDSAAGQVDIEISNVAQSLTIHSINYIEDPKL